MKPPLSPGWGILMCLFAACAVLCDYWDDVAEDFASAEATGGFPIAPLTPSARPLPCFLDFIETAIFVCLLFPLRFYPTNTRGAQVLTDLCAAFFYPHFSRTQ